MAGRNVGSRMVKAAARLAEAEARAAYLRGKGPPKLTRVEKAVLKARQARISFESIEALPEFSGEGDAEGE